MFAREFAQLAAASDRTRPAARTERIAGGNDGMVGRIATLQRTAGNRAVTALLQRQAGSTVTVQRDDPFGAVLAKEDEADAPKAEDMQGMVAAQGALKAKEKAATEGGPALSDDDRKSMADFPRKWKLRGQKDVAETLKRHGQVGPKDWFAKVKSTKFLGKNPIVHEELGNRLVKAEAKLADVDQATREGWITSAKGVREVGQGLHTFGLAIDINAGTNPFIVNPSSNSAKASGEPREQSEAVRAILDRAILLVLGKTSKEANFSARPEGAGVERADASYDKLTEASGAFATYFTLSKTENEEQLKSLVDALGAKDPYKGNLKTWRRTIKLDAARIGVLGGKKRWSDPTKGFIDLPKRLVEAMVDPDGGGLTWLGDDTIGSGRDVMHFDTRAVGPIKSIYRSQVTSGEESPGWRGLGDG